MKLDFSKFKKIKEDQKTATLKHPAGHTITIAKNGLHPDARHDLAKLPMHFDEGGEVPEKKPGMGDNLSKLGSSGMSQTQELMPTENQNIHISNAKPVGYADGGDVEQSQPPQQTPEPDSKPQQQPMVVINTAPQPNQTPASPPPEPAPVPNYQSQYSPMQALANRLPQSPSISNNSQMPNSNTFSEMSGIGQKPPEVSNTPRMAAPQAPTAPEMPMQNQPQAKAMPEDPFGADAYANNFQSGIDEKKAGMMGEAIATGQQGNLEAQIANRHAANAQGQLLTYQDNVNHLNQERQSFLQDLQNQHIDPNHYLNSMGTGGQIATTIGLILGGLGGGLTGTENPAQKFLNQQIERDVNAQKEEIGKKENLLTANMHQFGNLRDAMDMTRVMQSDIVSNQLKAAAAKSMDPIAKARALQAAGDLDMQTAPTMAQLATRRTLANGQPSSQGGQSQVDPGTRIRLLETSGVMPKEDAAMATKELGKVNEIEKLRANMTQAYQHLNNSFLAGSLSPNDRNSFINTYGGVLAKLAEGRFNLEESKQQMSAFMPSAGESEATRKDKLANMNRFFDSMKADSPALTKWKINVPRTQQIQTYAPQVGKQNG